MTSMAAAAAVSTRGEWGRGEEEVREGFRLSATVAPKFFPLYHFFPLFVPLFFHLPQRFP
jgi:hypothetical protein